MWLSMSLIRGVAVSPCTNMRELKFEPLMTDLIYFGFALKIMTLDCLVL